MLPVRLSLLLATMVSAAPPLVPAPWPPGLQIDGDLSEWKGPPTLVLDARDQRRFRRGDGMRRVSSPDDLSARIWVAVGEGGLVIAGEVNDDRFIPRRDQVDVWLSLPRARMPRIAYVNQQGENEIDDEVACETSGLADPDACKKWLKQQKVRRTQLEALFTRRYELGAKGIEESWASNSAGVDPALEFKCCAASQLKRVPSAAGWRFEARIAPEDFPLSGEAPLGHLQFGLELEDGDEEEGKRAEAVLLSVQGLSAGRPSSLQPVTLSPPLTFDSVPPLLVALRKEQSDRFYAPGHPVQKAFAFQNPAVGGQVAPTQPSPTVMSFTLGKLPRLTSQGDASLYQVHSDEGDWLWSFQRDVAVAHLPGTGALTGPVMRQGGQDLALLSRGTRSPFGTGECGACPNTEIRVVRLKGDGRLQQVFRQLFQEGELVEDGAQHYRYQGVEGSVKPDLSEIAFTGTQIFVDDGKETPRSFQAVWRFDPTDGRYVPPHLPHRKTKTP